MLNKLFYPGMRGLANTSNEMGKLTSREHFLEYVIDTKEPPVAPKCHGDADLWVNMQNRYYAEVIITKEYIKKSEPGMIQIEEYDMTIHCDVLLPYDRIAVTFQQVLAEVLGLANRIHGTIKVYRKVDRYRPRADWYIVKETPMMNIHQKL